MHLAVLGNFILIASNIFGLVSLILRSRSAFSLQSLSLILGSFVLFLAFILSDFSVQNVVFYSSTLKPMIFKIAGLWTNSDSSLLFLLSLLAIMSSFSVWFEDDKDISRILVSIYSFILLLISLYIYFLANPFGIVPNPPKEGFGLNPVLQDRAVSIHPPFLYLGYVSYIIPFAYSVSMLLSGKVKIEYMQTINTYSRLALGFLTSGIALGSWWAYRELGWGGYWFFDPVENISLLPWLIGVALHHSLLVVLQKGRMFKSVILLSILNFLLIALGIIIVRSGSLVSMHSFASNTSAGIYILIFFGIFGLSISYLCFRRVFDLEDKLNKEYSKSSKQNHAEKMVKFGNILFYLSALSILLGTLYPIIFKIVSGISVNLDNSYYHLAFLPLGFAITILSFYMIMIDGKHRLRKYIYPLTNSNIAMNISHLGVIVMAIAIIFNALYSKDMEFIGREGDSKEYTDKIKVTLQNVRYAKGPNYFRQIAEFWVDNDGEITILNPENRFYNVENAISSESDIYSFLTKDIYAVIGNVDENKNLYANIYVRPYMAFIWLGMFLTSLGFFVSFLKRS